MKTRFEISDGGMFHPMSSNIGLVSWQRLLQLIVGESLIFESFIIRRVKW